MPRFKDIYGPFSDSKRCRFARLGNVQLRKFYIELIIR